MGNQGIRKSGNQDEEYQASGYQERPKNEKLLSLIA
jgi:hypothetical protein